MSSVDFLKENSAGFSLSNVLLFNIDKMEQADIEKAMNTFDKTYAFSSNVGLLNRYKVKYRMNKRFGILFSYDILLLACFDAIIVNGGDNLDILTKVLSKNVRTMFIYSPEASLQISNFKEVMPGLYKRDDSHVVLGKTKLEVEIESIVPDRIEYRKENKIAFGKTAFCLRKYDEDVLKYLSDNFLYFDVFIFSKKLEPVPDCSFIEVDGDEMTDDEIVKTCRSVSNAEHIIVMNGIQEVMI